MVFDSISIRGIENNIVINTSDLIFDETDIDLFSIKGCIDRLYIFVFLNQSLNLLDPFAKKIVANIKNGVVGNIGRIIPKIPNPKNTNPKKVIIVFFILTQPFIKLD